MHNNFIRALIFIIFILTVFTAWLFTKPSIYRSPYPAYKDIYYFDPSREGGHLKPGLNLTMQGEKHGKPVRIITNSKGFRSDHEYSYVTPKKTYRILFLGDSFVDGMRTDQNDTIGYVLEKYLEKEYTGNSYKDFEVMISGHNNPANAWYYYQEHGCKYSPDLVILGITIGNDIICNNYETHIIPEKNSDGTTVLRLSSKPKQGYCNLLDMFLPEDAHLKHSKLKETIKKAEFNIRSRLSRKSQIFGYIIPPVLYPNNSIPGKVQIADFCISLGLFYNPISEEINNVYINTEHVLSGISEAVSLNQSDLLIVLFPVRVQISNKDWNLLTRFYNLNRNKFDLSHPNSRIKTFCTTQKIECLDLLPAFSDHYNNTSTPLYRSRGDMHFNEIGQRISGKVIGKKILEFLNN